MTSIIEIPCNEAESLLVDSLAKLTMTYTAEGFKELKNDIESRGQVVPILLRNNCILDGRHRYKACMELGINVKCTQLGDIPDSKAIDIVISNSIHKATNTDAAKVEAYVMCKAKGIAKSAMPNAFSRLNSNYVSKLSYIDKVNTKYLTVLLHQNSVRLYSIEFNTVEDYKTINSLWRVIKSNNRLSNEVIEVVQPPLDSSNYLIDLEKYFNNGNAEKEYWEVFNIAKDNGVNLHPDTELGKKIASIIKSNYRVE